MSTLTDERIEELRDWFTNEVHRAGDSVWITQECRADVKAALAELLELRLQIDLAFLQLKISGVPRERARTVHNGIGVLVTRFDRQAAAEPSGEAVDYRHRLYGDLVRRGYAQWYAHAIAFADRLVTPSLSDCERFYWPDGEPAGEAP